MGSLNSAINSPDEGWASDDREKARAMIKSTKPDGTRRHSNEAVAAYMGMSIAMVEQVERNIPKQAGSERLISTYTKEGSGPRGDGIAQDRQREQENRRATDALLQRIMAVHG